MNDERRDCMTCSKGVLDWDSEGMYFWCSTCDTSMRPERLIDLAREAERHEGCPFYTEDI